METIVRRIGLVAHDAMKKDMIEWVLWNSERLIGHKFYCTGTTGTLIKKALEEKHPEINYVGIEMYDSVLLRALQKMEEREHAGTLPENLVFLRMDARTLPLVFEKGEVGKIYLNFSDPWPKERHAKRRLTSRQFLERYNQILAADGVVEFKTDNKGLFEFSLEEVEKAGWKLLGHTFDLHHDSAMNEGNVMTEYEEKFSSMGNPIYKLIAGR